MALAHPIDCDIFCTVIDNFGDVGVCWRLARQLHAEHGWRVRLLVDDLDALHKLWPALDPRAARQDAAGIVIQRWLPSGTAPEASPAEPAAVVIEAFACDLPPAYLAAMAARTPKPVWINLDYLSAEDWVAAFHLRPSPHPRLALNKTFFFPGLGPGSGGVLRERGLGDERRRFEASPAARQALWAALDIPAPRPDATLISLFAYENPALDHLLQAWADRAGTQPGIELLVPQGRISGAVARFLGLPAFMPGTRAVRGNLTLQAIPFTDQLTYDRLLWACDMNFVRGEDSFIRAQWAERPFAWQIYPQADAAHLPKLDAALAHYTGPLRAAERAAVTRFWHAWNGVGEPDWADFWHHRQALAARASSWAAELSALGDLAGNLAEFCRNQLK
jgi:uncharacterized repeat protein (TIGR03837 family)